MENYSRCKSSFFRLHAHLIASVIFPKARASEIQMIKVYAQEKKEETSMYKHLRYATLFPYFSWDDNETLVTVEHRLVAGVTKSCTRFGEKQKGLRPR